MGFKLRPKRESVAPGVSNTAVQEVEQFMSELLESFPGGVVRVAATGAVLHANAEAQRFLRLTYDALTRRYTSDFASETFFDDGSPCPPEQYPVSIALATGKTAGPTVIGVCADGEEIQWAKFSAVPLKDEHGNVMEAVVTLIDITEFRQQREALIQSEGRLRSILESAPNPIVTTDTEGTIRFLNRTNVPDLDPESVIGGSILDFVAPDSVGTVREHIRMVVDTGEPREYRVRSSPETGANTYHVRVGPVFHEDAVVGCSFVLWDVTQLEALERRVLVADRMASIGTLAAGVAHEINNPLTYMMLILERMQRSTTGESGEFGARVAEALEGAARIRDIVCDLGNVVAGDQRVQSPTDLLEVLDTAARMTENQYRYRATLVREYGQVPRVHANASRLTQVFINLIVNASQALPEGAAHKNKITIRATADDSAVTVEVSDTGPGLDPRIGDRLFEPFVTTKPTGEGQGLGLYICYNILESMGGSISAVRDAGPGTTIRVQLKAATRTATKTTEAAAGADRSNSLRPMRVLIIDDERAIRSAIRRLLSDHDVTECASGREAIERLERQEYDVILCDLIMPMVSGMDIYRHISEFFPQLMTRVIFMTGGAFTEGARAFLETVDTSLLMKPFTQEALFAQIRETLSSSTSTRGS